MKKHVFLSCLLLLASGCTSVITGDNKTSQIDGRIDDRDVFTGPGNDYSSQGKFDQSFDGISQANSHVISYKHLDGFVDIALFPNSPGPFTGTPVGVSNQKVRSTFKVDKTIDVYFELEPHILAEINSTGQAKVEILMWVLNGVGTAAAAVPGSVYTVTYTFREDPNDIDKMLYSIVSSNGISSSGTISDNSGLIDRGQNPDSFTLNPGHYTVQFEMNILAGGDTDKTNISSESEFDLVAW